LIVLPFFITMCLKSYPERDSQQVMKKKILTFEALYKLYEKTILMETCRKLKQKELIEESMQETMIKIHKKFREISELEPDAQELYIRKIARGTATDIFRKEVAGRNHIVYMEDFLDADGEIAEEGFIMADVVLEPDLKEQLAQLTEGEREMIHLVFYEGYSYGEISSMLHISEDNARQKLYRAKKHLKAILEREK